MTKNNSLAARTKHIKIGSELMWSGRLVHVLRCEGISTVRGYAEAQYRVVGVYDGYVGTAFDGELKVAA
jgi:hypothetical protein